MDPTVDGTGQCVFDMNPGSRMPKPTNKCMSYTCSVRSKKQVKSLFKIPFWDNRFDHYTKKISYTTTLGLEP
jgi:hypothetical protein